MGAYRVEGYDGDGSPIIFWDITQYQSIRGEEKVENKLYNKKRNCITCLLVSLSIVVILLNFVTNFSLAYAETTDPEAFDVQSVVFTIQEKEGTEENIIDRVFPTLGDRKVQTLIIGFLTLLMMIGIFFWKERGDGS